jgi:hypothetical protein
MANQGFRGDRARPRPASGQGSTSAEQLAAELRADCEAANAYIERHGSFAGFVRAYRAGRPVGLSKPLPDE